MMRILVVDMTIPFPPTGGGKLRTYHLLRSLARRHNVTLVGFTYDGDEDPVPPPFPIQIVGVPWEQPQLYREMSDRDCATAQRAAERLARETEEPWFASILDSPPMADMLARYAEDGFDLALIEHSDMGRFVESLPPSLPKVIDFHNVYTRMALQAAAEAVGEERDAAAREAARTRRFESRLVAQCALRLVCSETEASAVRRLLGVDRVRVVPNGVDTSFFTPSSDKSTQGSLLFMGTMDYEPNIEAAQYFCAEIFPRVLLEIPSATLHVVGSNPVEDVRRLSSASVAVHGRVADVRPYYREAELVVVPLLRGGGTRLKVLEAAASGKAIVATTVGVEGLDFQSNKDLLVADAAAEFAHAVVTLHRDEARRDDLGRRARERALPYDWEAVGDHFCALIESLR